MGSVEVFMGPDDLRYYEKCKTDQERHNYVAHMAWRKLWDGPAKKMLKQLCDDLGVDAVNKKFFASITIEMTEEF